MIIFSFKQLAIVVLLIVFFAPVCHGFAAATCNAAAGETCPVEVNNGASNKDTTLPLREVIIPGKSTIDVSVAQGTLGIMAQYSKMIYQYMLALGSIIGVLSIMFAGLKMIISAGESKSLGEAKTMMMGTFKSLAVLYLAGLILYVINPTFFTFSGGSM